MKTTPPALEDLKAVIQRYRDIVGESSNGWLVRDFADELEAALASRTPPTQNELVKAAHDYIRAAEGYRLNSELWPQSPIELTVAMIDAREKLKAALLAQPTPHYESGNCPHCGAWVNFAQEAEIAKIELPPTPEVKGDRDEVS